MVYSGPNGTWKKGDVTEGAQLPVIAWRVWYSDGESVYAENPADLPNEGVQAVCAYHPGGKRTFRTSCDEYLLDGVSLLGEEMPTLEEYMEIYRKALADEWRPPTT